MWALTLFSFMQEGRQKKVNQRHHIVVFHDSYLTLKGAIFSCTNKQLFNPNHRETKPTTTRRLLHSLKHCKWNVRLDFKLNSFRHNFKRTHNTGCGPTATGLFTRQDTLIHQYDMQLVTFNEPFSSFFQPYEIVNLLLIFCGCTSLNVFDPTLISFSLPILFGMRAFKLKS